MINEKQLRALAKSNPKELARIITSPNVDIKMSTLGAEILGEEITDETIVFPTLKILLKNNHTLVRESAMIGISAFCNNIAPPVDILDVLTYISNHDPWATNKDLAKDLITTFNSNEKKQIAI